jgi:alpha/beta superfamily hydrolase
MAHHCPLDQVVETVRIPAGEGLLDGELLYPAAGRPAAAVVLAGPHPLLGGGLHNNVVCGLTDGLSRRGLAALRFAYRAAGGRQERARQMAQFWQTSHAAGEAEYADDLRAAAAFLAGAVGPGTPLVLAGYSFGCSLLPAAGEAAAFVLVAPTLGRHDLGGFADSGSPKLVIAPVGDFALDEAQLPGWFDRLPGPKRLVRPRHDGHFFRGQEEVLAQEVFSFLEGCGVLSHAD